MILAKVNNPYYPPHASSKYVFRPQPYSTIPMPFGVRSTGVHVLVEGKKEWRKKNTCIFLWCTHGHGKVWLKNKTYECRPEDIVVFHTSDWHRWESLTNHWRLRWFTMDGEHAESILKSFQFPREPAKAGACPEALFETLYSLVSDPHPEAESLASVYAFHILTFAGSHLNLPAEASLPLRIKAILDARYSDPNFGIDQLALELGIHRSTVTRAFTDHFRISPRKYLINYRMQRALGLLLETKLSVSEISLKCGFQDVAYFTRTVKSVFGMSPSQLRLRGY